MKTLLIKNIASLVSCDEQDRVYENVDLYAEDGVICAIGVAAGFICWSVQDRGK